MKGLFCSPCIPGDHSPATPLVLLMLDQKQVCPALLTFLHHPDSIIATGIITRTRQELDLLDQKAVMDFMQDEKPDLPNCRKCHIWQYRQFALFDGTIHIDYIRRVLDLIDAGFSGEIIYPLTAPKP